MGVQTPLPHHLVGGPPHLHLAGPQSLREVHPSRPEKSVMKRFDCCVAAIKSNAAAALRVVPEAAAPVGRAVLDVPILVIVISGEHVTDMSSQGITWAMERHCQLISLSHQS